MLAAAQNPYRMAEMALELQIERLRVAEITNARDAALHRLLDAYAHITEKNALIEKFQAERDGSDGSDGPHCAAVGMPKSDPQAAAVDIDSLNAHIRTLERITEELRAEIAELNSKLAERPPPTPPASPSPPPSPASYMENSKLTKPALVDVSTETESPKKVDAVVATEIDIEQRYSPPQTEDPAQLVASRHAVLAKIPLPVNPPDDTLSAILIPPPFTLHEFINAAPVTLKNQLTSYRILQNITTSWCPDREEHGYMYVPAFKCSTNPRIATAHRWNKIDVLGRLSKPTECFYNKDGVWYYAGSYKAFMLDYLSVKEWEQLPAETQTCLIKETLSARKNTTPQTTYETTQLYASGALKIACVGLQCVAFNQEVYRAIIEWGVRWGESKWRAAALASGSAPGGGKTTPGRRNQSQGSAGVAVAVASPTPSAGSSAQLAGSTMFNVASSAIGNSGDSPTRGRENAAIVGKR
ncbi:hypothetical protein M413DRAFT_115341 [Hebeloma cylindrosporum]|uniref:DUF6697 domain-containing protein n=1 Tax=Hebeloma cylindrosporum TaxID=76867 RepID=A0A0C3D0V6_HEBCY|nr:hypothetical protein M413DRAFT_115341 [Hebeloma cylindrosporum h7]